MSFHPYLFFGGNCREAFERYHEIFGGELEMVTAGDMPAEDAPPEGTPADSVMNAALMVGDAVFMGSDDPFSEDFGPVQGMQINFTTTDVAEAERVYAALAEGGQAVMPPSSTSWAASFGMCVDRFGTPWMIMADLPEG